MAEPDSSVPDNRTEQTSAETLSSPQSAEISKVQKDLAFEARQTPSIMTIEAATNENTEQVIVPSVDRNIVPGSEPTVRTTSESTTEDTVELTIEADVMPSIESTTEPLVDFAIAPTIGKQIETVDLTLNDEDHDEEPRSQGTFHGSSPSNRIKAEQTEEASIVSPVRQIFEAPPPEDHLDHGLFRETPMGDVEMNMADWNDQETLRADDCANLFGEIEDNQPVTSEDQVLEDLDRNDFDSELEDVEKRKAFATKQKVYDDRVLMQQNTIEDDIEFDLEQKNEMDRRNDRERRRSYKQTMEQEESLFVPDDGAESSPEAAEPKASFTYVAGDDENYQEEIHSQVDNSTDNQKRGKTENEKQAPKKRGRPPGSSNTKTTKRRKSSAAKPIRRGKKQSRLDETTAGLGALASLVTNDVAAQAVANQAVAGLPRFQNRRQDALRKLISSMPEDQRDLHTDDRKKILEAVKTFTPTARIDALQTGYKIRGLITSLYPHQIVGGAFIVKRERQSKPCGGMLSDEMGFGMCETTSERSLTISRKDCDYHCSDTRW